MKKRIALICAVAVICASWVQSAGAVNVIINSSFFRFPDQEPVVREGIAYIPVRAVAEKLGLEVAWDPKNQKVRLFKDKFFMEIVIGSNEIKTAGGVKKLPEPAIMINNRTMVPLKMIEEGMNLIVLWNEEYQRVIINGKIDTQTVAEPPSEEATERHDDSSAEESSEAEEEEEATDFTDDEDFTAINGENTAVIIDIPRGYYTEDTDDEKSFAYRSIDAFDAQHTYDWDIVTRYESYTDDSKNNGIIFIVRQIEPYQGEEYDITLMNQKYPEAPTMPERPKFPDIDFGIMTAELERTIVGQLFTDLGMEMPNNIDDMEYEDIVAATGLSEEEFNAQMEISMENADFSQVMGYDKYTAYQEEMRVYGEEVEIYREDLKIYREEYKTVTAIKDYAAYNFDKLHEKAGAEEWTQFFDEGFNSDAEVRYEGIEIVDINGKKVVHATIYAEDPDDEQGVYEYYWYLNGNVLIEIFGGTLYGSEAAAEVRDVLTNMTIQ